MKESTALKNEKSNSQGKLNGYKKRKRQLEDIRNDMDSRFDGYADDITESCRNVTSNMQDAVRISGADVVPDQLFKREYGSGYGDLSSARGYVVSEIQRVDRQISSTESEIAALNSRIANAEQREAKEREEKLKALFA